MKTGYSWQIQRSKWLQRVLICVYVLTLIACFLNALPLILKIGLACFCLLHAFLTLKKLARENWQLDYDEENGWQKIEAARLQKIQILPSTVISRYFIFLHYLCENKKNYRVIFKDALVVNINDFRQLIVTLKTYHQ
jgi:hypothetical protein